jgi:hypothetical protein
MLSSLHFGRQCFKECSLLSDCHDTHVRFGCGDTIRTSQIVFVKSSEDNKRDDDGAKRMFFGGERFLEGISREANVSA